MFAKNCSACNTFNNNPKNVKIKHRWKPATKSFQRVHVDFAEPFMGYNFLVLVDAYTRWLEIHIVRNINSEKTIKKYREIFTTFELPQLLVSDNGRTFISKEFQFFLNKMVFFINAYGAIQPCYKWVSRTFYSNV